ncbi:PEP-CTERM sorting domain-containing protein [bacterium]|nr:MAG: PEP-CTERM sorting domain-containing protein [bacterium]
MNTRSLLALAFGCAISTANAAIYSQAPDIGGDGGPYSYSDQMIADRFSLPSASSFDAVSWWGSYFFEGDPYEIGSTASFDITVYGDNAGLPGAALYSTSVDGRISAKAGSSDVSDTVYRFEGAVSAPVLNAGTPYWLSITESAFSGFRWHTSTQGGNYSAVNQGGGWVVETDRANMAFELASTEAVPEPATLAALTLGGLALLRRRRRA